MAPAFDSYPVEMAQDRAIRIEQLVAAPRTAVWDDLADLSSHGQWMMDAAAITVDHDGVPGVGTRMEVITRIGPLHTTDHMVVIAWDPPRRMAVRHRGTVGGEGDFTLEDRGDDTLVRWTERLEFPWTLGGPAGARAARPLLAAVWRANLRRFAARFR